MDAAVIAVAGTLLGGIVGSLGTYLNQQASYRRDYVDRQAALRRQAYVDWLRCLHECFSALHKASARYRKGLTDRAELQSELEAIPKDDAQVALEHLRLLCRQDVAAEAARLWVHIRRENVPRGIAVSGADWRAWSGHYWRLRRGFIDAARADLGLTEFDWSDAGAGPGDFPPFTSAERRSRKTDV